LRSLAQGPLWLTTTTDEQIDQIPQTCAIPLAPGTEISATA
jgi:hypothetical protein